MMDFHVYSKHVSMAGVPHNFARLPTTLLDFVQRNLSINFKILHNSQMEVTWFKEILESTSTSYKPANENYLMYISWFIPRIAGHENSAVSCSCRCVKLNTTTSRSRCRESVGRDINKCALTREDFSLEFGRGYA